MKTQPLRVLDKDAYDALELSAEAHGGIGRGCLEEFVRDGSTERGIPCCVIGHACFLDDSEYDYGRQGLVMKALRSAFCTSGDSGVFGPNDIAVHMACLADTAVIPKGQNRPRISFQEWCKRLNVVRGN